MIDRCKVGEDKQDISSQGRPLIYHNPPSPQPIVLEEQLQ